MRLRTPEKEFIWGNLDGYRCKWKLWADLSLYVTVLKFSLAGPVMGDSTETSIEPSAYVCAGP